MKASRRTVLKSLAVVTAGTALSGKAQMHTDSGDQELSRNPDLHDVRFGDMMVSWDKHTGTLYSIRSAKDSLKTNFLGNSDNVPGLASIETAFTGDIFTNVWNLTNPSWATTEARGPVSPSGNWERQLTGSSGDIRNVRADSNGLSVSYTGQGKNETGIRFFSLAMQYRHDGAGALVWDIEVQNKTRDVLEFGEFSLPIMANDFYGDILNRPEIHGLESAVRRPLVQQRIHQEKVIAHHFVAGHSSYSLLQRPAGTGPFLLIHPVGDTPFETITRAQTPFTGKIRGWEGPALLSVSSGAMGRSPSGNRGGAETVPAGPWVNGHTSFVLAPEQKRQFALRFVLVDSYDAVRDELAKAGNLGVRILPSMVVQERTPVFVDLQCKDDLSDLDLGGGDHINLTDKSRVGDHTKLILSFEGTGQKTIKVRYGQKRWTNLHFYCVEDVETLLKKRAEFIVDRQWYHNPSDPYYRDNMFLPYDADKESIFTDSDDVWEVGGSDEFGFSEPLFLAQKLVHFPESEQIRALETYVDKCLFKYIQDPETYEVKASLYYKARTPASPWGYWSKNRAYSTWRTYNYPHPANIYHALYLIGRRYGATRKREPLEYLNMSYRTCLKWFDTGEWRHIGLMCGSNAVNILEDLSREGLLDEHAKLDKAMRDCTKEFVEDPYPYGSELLIDQTAHEQVYFFTRYFGEHDKAKTTLKVIQALRGGNQPVWFHYGNDKRGDMACWYSESLNGIALLDGYERDNDPDLLLKGYAGLASVSANLRSDGMGFGWFMSGVQNFGHKPARTLDNGIGQWGFFRGAKSYIIQDHLFGFVGYGCRVDEAANSLNVIPHDGLRKRMHFVPTHLDIDCVTGELKKVEYNPATRSVKLELSGSTSLVSTAEILLRGLQPGTYQVRTPSREYSERVIEKLVVKTPLGSATTIEVSGV